jgi:uncharacterized protein YbaA (DUF1428 family)
MSGNDWGLTRYTEDGISLTANLGGFDVSLGSLGGVQYDNSNYMNASGNFGGADVNILMMNSGDNKAHGYDLSYDMNTLSVSASMNSDFDGAEYTSYGLTYNASDDLSASFSRTSYGDDVELVAAVAEVLDDPTTTTVDESAAAIPAVMSGGFDMANTNMAQDWDIKTS